MWQPDFLEKNCLSAIFEKRSKMAEMVFKFLGELLGFTENVFFYILLLTSIFAKSVCLRNFSP